MKPEVLQSMADGKWRSGRGWKALALSQGHSGVVYVRQGKLMAGRSGKTDVVVGVGVLKKSSWSRSGWVWVWEENL